jgi:flagellar hook-associated protein 2
MAITSPTFDPTKTATSLADVYVAASKGAATAQKTAVDAAASGLLTLRSAMSAFQTAVAAMTGKKSVLSNSATFSSSVGTATATSTAAAGNYSFYVEQLATASQVSYSGLAGANTSNQLEVRMGDGSKFAVDLSTADKDGVAGLSPQEIATAINSAAGNNARVEASTLTVNGVATLVLTSKLTGAANAATLGDPAGPGAWQTQLDGGMQNLSTAQDAKVWIGPKGTGTLVTQASNTYNIVSNVSMTFTKAQAAGESPVTLTVANDTAATAANVQAFVDAYNKLNSALADLTYVGNPSKKLDPGVFANDSGLNSLRSRMLVTMRAAVGSQSLTTFGIAAQRDGSLALDSTRLNKALAANPTTLDQIFGNASLSAPSGVLGGLNSLTREWTNTVDGTINARQAVVSKQQTQINTKLAFIEDQHQRALDRYKAQYTKLQTLQAQMSNTSGLFDSLFGPKST